MIGEIYKKTQLSAYQPSKEVCEMTADDKKVFAIGYEILNKPWTELNDMSVIDRMNKDQRVFNAFVDTTVENEADAWKWKGTRSMARNKAMVMHAQLTSSYLIPEITAQNEDDQEDVDMAEVMHDIIEWMTVPGNSNYQPAFLMASMGMLVNPVTYMTAEYSEIYQTIRQKNDDGSVSKKEILDEVLSGFQAKVYSADQVMLTNPYEQNIQKQRKIIKRRYIDYAEAEAQWGEHDNWQFVQPGVKSIYNEEDGLFYDVKDDEDVGNLVEESTALGRRDDTEVCYINGVYFGETDVESNPIKHRDNNDAPKYNITPFGYHRINEHFFFYKSMMNSLGWDNDLIDAMYETTMNKEFLDLLAPIIVTGEENVESDIVFPGSVTAFANKDTKASPLLPPHNNASGYNAIAMIEKSMSEGSTSDVQGGALPDPNQKAYSVAQASQNAKTMISGVGKTLGESVAQFGMLMVDIAVTHLTVAQVEELAGDQTKLKYKSFILNDKTVSGKKSNKRIKFDEGLMGYEMDDKQKEDMAIGLAEDIGYPNNKEHLYLVNPPLFARMKYLTRIDPERMFPRNQEYQQAMMNSLYTLLRQDPLIEPEVLVRKLSYAYFRGEGEELMAKGGGVMSQIMNAQQVPAQGANGQTPSSPAGNLANVKNLSTGLAGNVA